MYGQPVVSLAARLPRTERGMLRFDVALALAILAVGQLDVWATSFTGAHVTGPEPLVAVLYAATAIALVWRRSHPVGVLLFVIGIDTLDALAFGAPEGNAVFLPAFVALYSVGAHEPPRTALWAGLLAALVLALREVRNPESTSFDAVLDAAAWDIAILGGTSLGAYFRTRRLYLAELSERAARAEREREEGARAAVDEERSRIARELHDAVAHGVSVMVVQAEAAEEVLERDPARTRDALLKIQSSGREALVELRRLVGILKEDGAEAEHSPAPGLRNLDGLIGQLRDSGVPVELAVHGHPVPLTTGLDLTAYRIVQESLTNVLKHAGPARASVLLDYRPERLELEVTDDGTGAASPNGAGHGLAGMGERVSVYGGTLEAGPAPGGGFRVRAKLPISRAT